MNEIRTINSIPITKDGVIQYALTVKESILSGEVDILLVHSQVKAFEKVIKELCDDKDIREAILKQAEREGGKSFEKHGVKFTIAEVGVKYDFSGCEDSQWNELAKQIAELTEKQKSRQDFLKTINGEVYDGNGVQLFAPSKKSTTSVNVTLK